MQVLAVGVGSRVDNDELRSIAMNNSDNVIKLTSFDQLASSVKNLTKEMCQGTGSTLSEGVYP